MARENVDEHYKIASELAKEVVERSYPTDDVATLRHFQKESMEVLVMLLQKINAFTLLIVRTKMMRAKQKKLNLILILVCLVI